MHRRLAPSLLLGLSLSTLGLVACGDDSAGDDGSNASTGNATGNATGDSGPAATTDPDTGPGTTDPGDTTSPGDTGPAESTGADSTGPSAGCQAWEIRYELTGSEFELSDTPMGAGDQVNTVMEPYDQDDHVGPGDFVLQFQDVDGAPGGLAYMYSYDMILNFIVDGAVTVTTDLEQSAGPEECGITVGALNGTTVAWAPPVIADRSSMGSVLCEGALCGFAGLPDGKPQKMDETSDQPLSNFEFSEDLTTFTMAETIVAMDESSTASWTYLGTEVSRELVDAPDCLCR